MTYQEDVVNSLDMRDHLAAQIKKGGTVSSYGWDNKKAAEHLIREGLVDLYALETAAKAPLQTAARSRKKTTTTEGETA